ncbi:hypothetical protein RND81_10G161400 [Saponaria officinalis]|uniref:Uncharacterized protein n=1 Tax=Saponaria officinalis TaxID=3572 RepID=A0AAW1I572_SAPOF
MNCAKVICRLSNVGCKLKSVPNFLKSASQSPASASPNPISRISRLPVESSCIMTMLPLHSAIASARLQSVLSVDSHSWCLVPQGMSMPL